MAIEIAGPVPKLISAALSAASLRHEVISSNIANINTAGYKPMRVSFEDQLNLSSRDMLTNDNTLSSQLKTITPRIYESSETQQVNQLDMEMINMAKNTLHYRTLLTGLKGYMSIMKTAIKEGKL